MNIRNLFKPSTVNVFVYGTLRYGLWNYSVIRPYIIECHSMNGTINGNMYVPSSIPYVVLGGSGIVHGEWYSIHAEGLQDLDILEGYQGRGKYNLYDRSKVSDLYLPIKGYIYHVPLEDRELCTRFTDQNLVRSGDYKDRCIVWDDDKEETEDHDLLQAFYNSLWKE